MSYDLDSMMVSRLATLDEVRAAMQERLQQVVKPQAVGVANGLIYLINMQLRKPNTCTFPIKIVLRVEQYEPDVMKLVVPLLRKQFDDNNMSVAIIYTEKWLNIEVFEKLTTTTNPNLPSIRID